MGFLGWVRLDVVVLGGFAAFGFVVLRVSFRLWGVCFWEAVELGLFGEYGLLCRFLGFGLLGLETGASALAGCFLEIDFLVCFGVMLVLVWVCVFRGVGCVFSKLWGWCDIGGWV